MARARTPTATSFAPQGAIAPAFGQQPTSEPLPSAQLALASAPALADNAWTRITWATVPTWNVGGLFDASQPDRLVARWRAGLFAAELLAKFPPSVAGQRRARLVKIDAAGVETVLPEWATSNQDSTATVGGTRRLMLRQGEAVAAELLQTSGGGALTPTAGGCLLGLHYLQPYPTQ